MGATPTENGVHFSLFSRHATQVWLMLFDTADAASPVLEVRLDPRLHRIGDVWTVFVKGLAVGAFYSYRIQGPNQRTAGHLFDAAHPLIDPFARGIAGDPSTYAAKCVVINGDVEIGVSNRPRTPIAQTIIYEVHVKGLTAHPSSLVNAPGTFLGVVEKIPYLKALGITAVELLPVYQCGERELPRSNPETKKPLTNYWGYSPIGLFAPDTRFTSTGDATSAVHEFRAMVSALHDAGIEVILDVVYNHTSEKAEPAPAQSFKGIDNSIYYILDENGGFRDLTGCGNTLNCNHPVVREMILDSLRYWVTEMHVDGFRFDLASVLRRDRTGHILHEGPLIEHITEDPILQEVKLIAEPWDLGGSYLVGAFGGEAWAEWNAQYRDDVRRFWRGDHGAKNNFALRITGSQDLYGDDGRTPLHSINFITAHDGFTLRDLVSYNVKHNLANGEENRDGLGENFSWNCGVEGETTDPTINALRLRMQKNYLATLFTSLGVPMITGGDEFGRTQLGNNNAYCQDNEISWLNWEMLESNRELFEFCKRLIAFRKENTVFSRHTYFTGRPPKPGDAPDISWFDTGGKEQTWTPDNPELGCWINASENGGVALYLAFNPSIRLARFKLPPIPWRLRIDTWQGSEGDAMEADRAPRVQPGGTIVVRPKSMMVLTSHEAR
ncbi:MAG TPA: glycogen debranching protein GlgX [Candidatus Hydrogenedentes bacterium]|nr:glycogen debranching protein GlgX [Candidatus Hydrogenedentota bacterium]HRK33436.1 glycogen debranching protein GlgX [Candidatus Hydrogenedentota bacterium]